MSGFHEQLFELPCKAWAVDKITEDCRKDCETRTKDDKNRMENDGKRTTDSGPLLG